MPQLVCLRGVLVRAVWSQRPRLVSKLPGFLTTGTVVVPNTKRVHTGSTTVE